jgi:hypothetical protein
MSTSPPFPPNPIDGQILQAEDQTWKYRADINAWEKVSGALYAITGLVSAGSNITVTGSGTLESPYSIALPAGGSYPPDAAGLLANRGTYDAQPEGFSFLATDTGDLYFRETATPGTWSDPVPFFATVTESIEATQTSKVVSPFSVLRQVQATIGDGSLPHLKRAIWNKNFSARQPSAITILIWGDSIARDFIFTRAEVRLFRQHGWKGYWIGGSAHNGTWAQNRDQVGVTDNITDFARSTYGETKTVATSGAWGFRISTTPFENNDFDPQKRIVDQFTICYVKSPGAGAFKVQYRETSGPWIDTVHTAIDASAASEDYGEITVQVPRGAGVSARVVENGVGPVTFLGVLAQDSTASGIIIAPFTRGGINVTQAAQTNPVLVDGLMRLLKPDLCVWNAADDLSMLQQDLDNVIQKFDNAWPYHDWAFILHSVGVGASFYDEDVESAQYIRNYAAQNSHYLFDMRAQSRDFDYSNREVEPYRNITSITRSGSTATATLANHGFIASEVVRITGASNGYNAVAVRVTPTGPNTFTYAAAGTFTSPAANPGQVARIIGWQHDSIHCSEMGRDMQSIAVMRDMGLLDGMFSDEHRNIQTTRVEATNEIILRGESMAQNVIVAREAMIAKSRGILIGPDVRSRLVHDKSMVGVSEGDYTMFFAARLGGTSMGGVHARESLTTSTNVHGIVLGQNFTGSFSLTKRSADGTTNYAARFLIPNYGELIGKIVWVHAVRRSGYIEMWVNGVRCQEFSENAVQPEQALAVDTKFFMVDLKTECYEAAFWKSALTPAQILSHYIAGKAPGNPEILYEFDEQAGMSVADKSGNGYDGRFGNSPTTYWPEFIWLAARRSPAGTLPGGLVQIMPVNTPMIATRSSLTNGTLPASPLLGDRVIVSGQGAGGWRIAQPASHQIVEGAGATIGTNATTAGTGGHLSSTARYDSVELVCVVSDPVTPSYIWAVARKNGTLTWV